MWYGSLVKFITKLRRDRWRDQVLDVGKRLRDAQAARNGVDSRVWPDDTAYLDGVIDRLTRRRDRLLTNLKETA